MICPVCGAEVPEKPFCENCGSRMDEGDAAREPAISYHAIPLAQAPAAPVPASSVAEAPEASHAHKAPVKVLAVVGVAIVVLVAVFLVAFWSVAGTAVQESGRQGYDVGGLVRESSGSALPDSSGAAADGVVDSGAVASAASSGATSESASSAAASSADASSGASGSASSSSASSDASGSHSSASSATSSASAAAASSSASAAAVDSRWFDSHGNPTLYDVVELKGAKLGEALDVGGYTWIPSASAWMSANGSIAEVEGPDGMLSEEAIAKLKKGGEGQPVTYVIMTQGYDTPFDALAGLANDVVVRDMVTGDEEIAFAVVRGESSADFLVAVTKTDEGQQTFLVFNDQAVSKGMFETLVGVDAGDSIAGVWKVLAAE